MKYSLNLIKILIFLNDTLAVILAICAKIKYNYIYIDLIITKRIIKEINNFIYG